jgi:thiol:disulfide interchange protein DsbA
MIKQLFFSLSLVSAAAIAAEWKEGTDYKIVNPAGKTNQPTVVEVFSYGCPHCYQEDPEIEKWLKTKPANIKFERIAAHKFNAAWDVYAKMYYTAQALGIGDKTHSEIFARIHVQSKHSWTEDDVIKFFKGFGKGDKEIKAAMNGFYVDGALRKSETVLKKYRISGVPTMLINDKYTVSFRPDGKSIFPLVEYLANLK